MSDTEWEWPKSEETVWTATVEQDPDYVDECMIVFPPDLIAKVGWEIGDTIEWELREDGTAVLTKKN
jgi:hypothetical protein